MQWILLLICLIIIFRYDQIRAFLQGVGKKNNAEIDDKKDSENGDFIDYEEIE